MSENEIHEDFEGAYHFEFGAKTFLIDPLTELRIDENNVSGEFSKQGSRYGYVAVLVAKAESAHKMAKLRLDEAEKEAYKLARKVYADEGIKATEAMVGSDVVLDEDVKRLAREAISAKEVLDTLKAFEGAFRMRSEMLIGLGLRQRAELSQTAMTVPDMKGAVSRARSREKKAQK